MFDKTSLRPDINSWLEDELYQEYLHDRRGVDETWKAVFESNGGRSGDGGAATAVALAPFRPDERAPTRPEPRGVVHGPADQLVPLRGAAARIVSNM